MPPPKKPKNGPTSVEQFLSREELQRMEETTTGDGSGKSSPSGDSSGGGNGGGKDVSERKKLSPSSSVSSPRSDGGRTAATAIVTTTNNNNNSSPSSPSLSSNLASVLGSGGGAAKANSPPGSRTGLLRQLFAKQDPDTQGLVPPSSAPPPLSLALPPPHPHLPEPRYAKSRNGDRVGSVTGGGGGRQWTVKRGGKLTSGAADHDTPTPAFQHPRSMSRGRGGGGGSSIGSVQGDEAGLLTSKVLMERSYLTSLIKESPPLGSSSGAMAAPFLERVALNSGKLLQGLMGAPAPPTYIHAAFQLPLMDTSTSGPAMTGPRNTSVLAYLTAQGHNHHHSPHPHPPLPTALPPLPRCCAPSSLPLVDVANTTPLTSFSSSFPASLVAVPTSGANEPFDLSVKKLSRSGSSVESESAGSDKMESASRPGSSAGELATGIPLSLGTSSANNSSTSTSPAVANTPPARGDRDGSASPSLPRGLTPTHYLMDLRGPTGRAASSPLGKLFAHDITASGNMGLVAPRPYPGNPRSSPADSRLSPIREPSDSKASGSSSGDSSHGHARLAASGGPGPTGAGPGGGGVGPGVGGVPGMPGHSLMSGSSGHLQAPTSTTPEGGGTSLHPSFLSMEHPHASPLGSGEIQIKQEISAGSSTPAKVCQVCNDNASGFHYGVWSCEGCKAFFKRSIQGPVDYMCPATNNCTIDKHRRKSCQACRLRKCYEVGMNKGSQRKDRKSSSGGATPKGKRCRADSTDTTDSATNGGGASASKSAKRSRSLSILEALQKAALPVLESYHNHDQPLSRVNLLNTLIKIADRELVYLINWAKHVPGYTDLSLSDQVHLIECCWMELLLLNCAFRSMEHDGKHLVFAPDFHLDRHLWSVMGMTEILEQVSAVSEQMVQFAVTKEELLLLQATVLVNAGDVIASRPTRRLVGT
ncbi:uncharacterized protein [Littorina saxatilis]|uniref:uncharacterized protein isoform X2 n=1 Tax=Littorina saxatilis TaxID=31220 RepID=UPI0038B45322